MGKRRGRASAEASKESTPFPSDSDGDEITPKGKKGQPLRKEQKSSAELCDEYNVQDVDLEYAEADYLNLTTFNLFVRMVRPQIVAVNPRVAASKMTAILEAKWREFKESKVSYESKKETEEAAAREEEEDEEEEEEEEEEQEEEPEIDEDDQDEEEPVKGDESISEEEIDDQEQQETEVTEEDEEEEEEEDDEPPPPKKKKTEVVAPIRIKMPVPMRKSQRDRKTTAKKGKSMTDREFEKLLRSDLDSESVESEDSKPKKRHRKGPPSASDFENGLDSDFEIKPKKRAPKKKAPPKKKRKVEVTSASDSFTISESESPSIDESADSDFMKKKSSSLKKQSSKKKPAKKAAPPPEKPRIPGERKSERQSNKPTAPTEQMMTDKEFEQILKAEEAEMKEKKKKKEQERKKQKKEEMKKKKERAKMAGKKGYWHTDGKENNKEENGDDKEDKENQEKKSNDGEDGNVSDHYWYCGICRDGGDLLLCDTCPRSFHKECIKLETVPDGKWSCPKCEGKDISGLESEEEEEEDEGHDHNCFRCKKPGDVLLCDFCTCVYHPKCLNPPLKDIPDGDWKCPVCYIREKPLKGEVEKILTWKWTHLRKGEDVLDHTHSPHKKTIPEIDQNENSNSSEPEKAPERELFVKFKYHSYWDCEWIPELAFEVFHKAAFTMFTRKWDLDEPPALEDGSSFGKPRHQGAKADDPHNLEETYYRYGIKPEWLQIHRICTHEGKGRDTRYLVKWRDLAYNYATWEYPEEVPAGLEDWQKEVDRYWAHRKMKLKDQKEGKKKEKKMPKKSLLKKKMEKQPEIIDATGGKLHAYQLEGLNWLRFSWAQDTNTILADEMGLGKTIQAISFLYTLWKEGYMPGPFIISAPLSTVPNWEREFEFWAPDMYVLVYHGSRETRAVIRERDFGYHDDMFPFYHKACKVKRPPKFDVLLTSYEMVSVDIATLQSIEWSCLVIDEAHRLKNNQSLFFRTLSQYKIGYKLLLTGTPLQNNLEELFNLLNFLEPEKFHGMEEFLEQFEDISKDEQVQKLHQMLAPHMLRRIKSDVLKDLPSKSELIVRIELSAMQKKFYKHILTKNFEALNVKGHSNSTSLMNIMMDLRKCCNHPYLFPTGQQDAPMTARGMYEGTALIKACGKLDLLDKMLSKLRESGHRVLIFSQMTRMLDILEDFLEAKDYKYERIDGSIMGPKRQESIDRFNSSDSPQFVFLLSTKAGGLGINLATADTVVIYDMDWNPHNDIQAFSRAHRIGQQNKVMIYRFVSKDTIEERMAEVCKKKMMLTELVIHRGMAKADKVQGNLKESTESLTKQEINQILKSGAEKLFKDDEAGKVVYDEAAVEKLLDRDAHEETVEPTDEEGGGMNEYLRSFKVASYNVKEGAEDEEEEEEEEKEKERERDDDPTYWARVLGESYDEYVVQKQQEEEARIASFGKGKRVRKRINYAETRAIEEMMNKRREEQLKKTKAEEEGMSDYDPNSAESESEEEIESGEEEPQLNKNKKGRPAKKVEKEVFPPLVWRSRVTNQIEVLGFTPRQRRAFLDTVMRFGMPPDDPYNSQWLVRELRGKSERIFKAYCALFLRHLCEPVPENAEFYSDGVPIENLSRKHVLTRIGMIALLRRKVNQYEKLNGTFSMREFTARPEHMQSPYEGNPISDATNKQAETPKGTDTPKGVDTPKGTETPSRTDTPTNLSRRSETPSGSETPMDSASGFNTPRDSMTGTSTPRDPAADPLFADIAAACRIVKDTMDTERQPATRRESPLPGAVKPSDSGDKPGEESSTKSPAAEAEGNSADATEKSDIASNEDSKDQEAASSKDSSRSASPQNDKEKTREDGEQAEERVPEKASEPPEKTPDSPESAVFSGGSDAESSAPASPKAAASVSSKESAPTSPKESSTSPKGSAAASPKGSAATSPKGSAPASPKEEPMDLSEHRDSKDNDPAKKEDSNDVEMKEEKDGKPEEVDDAMEVDSDRKEKSENDTKTDEKDETESKASEKSETDTKASGENDKVQDDDKENDKVEENNKFPGPEKLLPARPFTPETLRDRLWIADGDFTELHALWMYEEQQLKSGHEYRNWHRLHDFWLLAGIVSHGYRHWQEILADPRFAILNAAFNEDSEVVRTAAFLNRRFQLLEQALVIEEQLRKAACSPQIALISPTCSTEEMMRGIDQLADDLKRLNQGQKPLHTVPNQQLYDVWNLVTELVMDVRQSTYSNMPATLAKMQPSKAPQAMMPQQQRVVFVSKNSSQQTSSPTTNHPKSSPGVAHHGMHHKTPTINKHAVALSQQAAVKKQAAATAATTNSKPSPINKPSKTGQSMLYSRQSALSKHQAAMNKHQAAVSRTHAALSKASSGKYKSGSPVKKKINPDEVICID